jgi:hypothetical protein
MQVVRHDDPGIKFQKHKSLRETKEAQVYHPAFLAGGVTSALRISPQNFIRW